MEASLLPSEELRKLSDRAVVVAVRGTDPACEVLVKEFSIFHGSLAVAIVLDGKGETLACWSADGAAESCTRESVNRFPAVIVEKLKESLARAESTQLLERRASERPKDEAAFEALVRRLKEAPAVHPLRNLCIKVEAAPELPRPIRARARMARFIVEEGFFAQDFDKEVREGEDLLVEFAAHPEAAELVHPLSQAYTGAYVFDYPRRTADALKRLEDRAKVQPDPAPLRLRITGLSKQMEVWKSYFQRNLEGVDEKERGFAAARLGDAETAVRILSQPQHENDPVCRKVLRLAREKTEPPKK